MLFLFTHNDLDGVSCGLLARLAFGDQAEVRYNSVDGLNREVERFLNRKDHGRSPKNDILMITDLSVNEANAERLNAYAESGGRVRLIDHHRSALELSRYPWADVTVAYEDGRLASAASLLYDYLLREGWIERTAAADTFVEWVRQYDTWEWEALGNLKAKQLNDLFFLWSIEDFEEAMMERLRSEAEFAFTEFEEKLLGLEQDKIDRYVRRKKRELVQTFIADRCVGIVHAESYHSELSSELGKEHSHLDYIAILNMGGRKMSLRTIHDEVDVSEIAGKYGGGGHAKASGCPLTEEAYASFVDSAFGIDPVRPDASRNRFNVKGSDYGNLYDNREAEQFYVFTTGSDWRIDRNGETMDRSFPTFEAAEHYIKRHHQASLVRDELFVKYLMEHMLFTKKELEAAAQILETQ
ncbi:oligoribonuclease [Cohnella sp. CFH 77786]|uniref:DHH family phosphoesterase n=1 Tax=Cohnella sp. CFH 77786 TaxID=2662265 RepID=UPI001C60EE14|nr:oligoribonuclease [Cohnella sp. CFH 77786]MBW5446344.1 oligoribonuclease [Cohnella sp. CFH 77786]